VALKEQAGSPLHPLRQFHWIGRRVRLRVPFRRFGGFRGAPRVLSNVSREDCHNRAVIPFGRVPSDPFEGVDATETYLQPWVPIVVRRPELVDGPREAVCDLPLLSKPLCLFLAFARLFQLIRGARPCEVQPAKSGKSGEQHTYGLNEVLLLRGVGRMDPDPKKHDQQDGSEDGSGYGEPYQATTIGLVLVARSHSIFLSRFLRHSNAFRLPPIPSRQVHYLRYSPKCLE
jgi:hypothetical protein